MADIIINGPEGQSTINNIPAWATEATQKTIADSLKGIGSSADKIEALLQLQSKGIKVAYVTFDDEGHGFRKANNIIRAMEAELTFYQEVFNLVETI